MAEILLNPDQSPVRRPVRIEVEPDGSILIWVDPRAYNVQLINGRGQGATEQLYTRVIISPWLAPETGIIGPHSRETDLQKSP